MTSVTAPMAATSREPLPVPMACFIARTSGTLEHQFQAHVSMTDYAKLNAAGEEYRKKREAELKIQRTGAKIRSSYIAFAVKEKKRLEADVQALIGEIAEKRKEVARLKDIAERADSLSAEALEHRKQSSLYRTMITQANALKSLQREQKKLQEREKALGEILDTLRNKYNPNYQDMAVLEAVRGWEHMANLPHINQVGKEEEQERDTEEEINTVAEEGSVQEEEKLEDGMWSKSDLETKLGPLLETDYESLLLAYEEHVDSGETSSLFNIAYYIPDPFLAQYEELKGTFISWLQKFGVIQGSSSTAAAADSSHAHRALTDAENQLSHLADDKQSTEEKLSKLSDPHHFGVEGEWKKLDGTCLETTSGEYTYEVCLFGEARQKPMNGGSTNSLGRFESWNPSAIVRPGEPAYYQKQMYKHGARCWNGPDRSVVLVLSCGTENTLTSVVELEKCEYQFTGTSPAVCFPVEDENKEHGKQEL
ncbi:hypothetical protein AX17_004958 [Amanita inopinata Kibby_2008]|nr:hypothetical protein AX17_004958 [Amanita inopinata Kibby_2008]